jgi:hypothetical protein
MRSEPKQNGVTHVSEHLLPLTPVQTEGGGWGEGLMPGSLRSFVPRRPLPPSLVRFAAQALKGRGRVFPGHQVNAAPVRM